MVKIYAGTVSDPDKLYFGIYQNGKRYKFKGLPGFWVVWDDGVMNAPRLTMEDHSGEPMGFTPYVRDGVLYGYMRDV
jgi:hypothetical protein